MSLHWLGVVRSAPLARLANPATATSPAIDAAVRWIVDGPLAAAVVVCPANSLAPMTHATLLKAIHRHVDVLPVRFGAVLPDERAVRECLRARTEGLLGELTRLEGTGEIGLRVQVRAPLETARPLLPSRRRDTRVSAGEYLASRRSKYADEDRRNHEANLVSDRYVRAIQGLVREHRTLTPAPPGLVRLAFLVERSRWEAALASLRSLAAEAPAAECTLMGPWPPYSFVYDAVNSSNDSLVDG